MEKPQDIQIIDEPVKNNGGNTVPVVQELLHAEKYVPSELEKQIFGQRIRVENQTGIRLLLKVYGIECQWRTVLECNSSVDVGPLTDLPVKITYEPYGQVVGWVNSLYTLGGTIVPFDLIHTLSEITSDKYVLIGIKKVGELGLADDVTVKSCFCKRNPFLQNLFPAVEYHVLAGYSYLALFAGMALFRYVLGLCNDPSVCDVNVAATRLMEEWNPALYTGEHEGEAVSKIVEYIKLAKNMLLAFPRVITEEEQLLYHKIGS
jgi:hypothetical protein